MRQTSYDFAPCVGVPGGLYDLTDNVCDSYNNEENDGALKFGMGVVKGSAIGKIAKPTSSSVISDFEGVLLNGLISEHDMNGDVKVLKNNTVGVIKRGRVWARLAEDAVPAYGTPVLLVVSGPDAGLFTTEDDLDNASNVIAVNAVFIGGKGTGDVAPIEVYPNVVAFANSFEIPAATETTIGGVKVGTGLEVSEDGTLSVSAGSAEE